MTNYKFHSLCTQAILTKFSRTFTAIRSHCYFCDFVWKANTPFRKLSIHNSFVEGMRRTTSYLSVLHVRKHGTVSERCKTTHYKYVIYRHYCRPTSLTNNQRTPYTDSVPRVTSTRMRKEAEKREDTAPFAIGVF